jgi:co-chaperonin GroES (HSP10)
MIKAADDYVIIEPEKIEEYTLPSGIIVTNPRTKTRVGRVTDVGKNVDLVKVGDKVSFFTNNTPEIDGYFSVSASYSDCKIICVYNN